MSTLRERLRQINGLTDEDFEPNKVTEVAEDAYLLAEYNSILIEMIMEDEE